MPLENLIRRFQPVLKKLDASLEELNRLTVEITETPAPPFKEHERGELVAAYFQAMGYVTKIDAVGNVVAASKAIDSYRDPIIISAHLDTVFTNSSIQVTQKGQRMYAPGVGDDSRGLANLVLLAKLLRDDEISQKIVFVATVGEEGRGDLRGVKYLFSDVYKWEPQVFITIDGTTTEQVVNKAIGSLRFRLYFKGPGGHSFGSFGTVNPAYSLGNFMHQFSGLRITDGVKSSFSLGVVGGGTSINAIPQECWVDIDLRSESPDELVKMKSQVLKFAAVTAKEETSTRTGEITYELEEVGNRPAGQLSDDRVPNALQQIHDYLGIGLYFHGSSTDANVPLSQGIPAISVASVQESGRSHTQEEWIDVSLRSLLPVRRNLLLVAYLAETF